MVGGAGGVLAWVVWVACLRECRASVGDVGGLCLCASVCFISTRHNKAKLQIKINE